MVIYVPAFYGGVGAGVLIGNTHTPAARIPLETNWIGPFVLAMERDVVQIIVKDWYIHMMPITIRAGRGIIKGNAPFNQCFQHR